MNPGSALNALMSATGAIASACFRRGHWAPLTKTTDDAKASSRRRLERRPAPSPSSRVSLSRRAHARAWWTGRRRRGRRRRRRTGLPWERGCVGAWVRGPTPASHRIHRNHTDTVTVSHSHSRICRHNPQCQHVLQKIPRFPSCRACSSAVVVVVILELGKRRKKRKRRALRALSHAPCLSTRPSYSTARRRSSGPQSSRRSHSRSHERPAGGFGRVWEAHRFPAGTPAIPADWADCFLPIFRPEQPQPVIAPSRRPTIPPSSTSKGKPPRPCPGPHSVRPGSLFRVCRIWPQHRCPASAFGAVKSFEKTTGWGVSSGSSASHGCSVTCLPTAAALMPAFTVDGARSRVALGDHFARFVSALLCRRPQ